MPLRTVWNNPWVQAVAILAILLVLAGFVYLLSPVLTALGLAFIVAYILNPVVHKLERRRIPRTVSIAGMAAAGLLILVSIPLLMAPQIIQQADELRMTAAELEDLDGDGEPDGYADWVGAVADRLPLDDIVIALGWAPENGESFHARAVLAERIGEIMRTGATQLLVTYAPHFWEAGRQAGLTVASFAAAAGSWALQFIVFVFNVALFAFVAGYLLRDFDGLVEQAKSLTPPRFRPKVFDIGRRIDHQLQGFLRGQLTVAVILFVLYSIGFTLSGVPFALLIALFGGAACILPYIGPLLTITPAIILTLLRYGVDWHIAAVLLTFVIIQAVETNLITPNILGNRVGLHPVWVILAVLVFGTAFGFLGIIIAVPLAAVLKVLVEEGIAFYRASPLFIEPPAPD